MTLIARETDIPTNDYFVKANNKNLDKVVVRKNNIQTVVWERIAFTFQDFLCTSEVQEFKVPVTGLYKLEAWGGSGGRSYAYNNPAGNGGGKGGYSCSYQLLEADTKLYIYVGTAGSDTEIGSPHNVNDFNNSIKYIGIGGWNGGSDGNASCHQDAISYRLHYFLFGGGAVLLI